MIDLLMKNIESILKQISEIVVKEKTQQEEKRKRGENFNIFSVLGLSTSEVRLHSAFLGELLNPDGDHGLGSKFLEAFIDSIINRVEPEFEIDTKTCKVSVEYPIGEILEDYTEGGRIDLLIRDDKNHAIVIENKIYAADQKKQLLRYQNYAKKNFQEYILLYLTLDGKEADKYSTDNKVDYQCISYKNEILSWLNQCISISALFPKVREIIAQYKLNLEQLLGSVSENNEKTIIDFLIKESNIEATMSICHYKDEIDKKIRKDFIDIRLLQLAKKHGTELKYDEEFINLPSGDQKGYKKIRFINKEYPGYFQIENYGNEVYYGIVADGYREEEKKELEQFDDWCDGKSKLWPYGTKFFPGDLSLWDGKDTLIDMVKGNQLISIIDNELTRIEQNQLIKKLDKEIRKQE